MDFDLQWLLIGLPLAFGLGWLASRLDLRQWRRERRDSPRAYFKGLNLLLNEQQDKAIDAFIEAVQQDPDTSELHFALGNLFRRRGEYERAIRVHEHLLNRADLPRAERDRAQHALAQDFMSAGLFDRAEQAWHVLEGGSFDTEARLALLTLHERSRNWRAAAEVAHKLERSGTGSYASRIAHYWCELAEEADARQAPAEADDALRRAREAAPLAARPLVLAGRRARQRDDHTEAVQIWGTLLATHPASFGLVAVDFAHSAQVAGQTDTAIESLRSLSTREPGMDLLNALAVLDPATASRQQRLRLQLQQHPSLSAARALLQLQSEPGHQAALDIADSGLVEQALGQAAKPLQRYRCAACGFEAQHYFWQCPGCLSWDSYPPKRLEDFVTTMALRLPSREHLAASRVLVVGDAMLDRYWFGNVDRISPEAPVPVVRVTREEERLGGAANVALNVKTLGAQATLMTVVGTDEPARKLQTLLEQQGVSTLLGHDPQLFTIVKLRVIGRAQQLLRIDFENQPDHEVLAGMLSDYERTLPDHHAVLFSDYGKGGLTHIPRMIELARAAGKPVLIDPKGSDYSRYAGATVITPNRAELAQVIGPWNNEAELHRRAHALREQLGLDGLLLTRSEEGMSLFDAPGGVPGHTRVPAQAREVFDVTGAGDTVIATLAALLAAGLDLRTAMPLANRAGGIVVGKFGTASVSFDELWENA